MNAPYAFSNRADGLLNARLVFNSGNIIDGTVIPCWRDTTFGVKLLPPPHIVTRENTFAFDHINESGTVVYLEA